jgi:hypothetical protein
VGVEGGVQDSDASASLRCSGGGIPFNGLAEIPAKIEKLHIKEGVQVHLSRKQRRYIVG